MSAHADGGPAFPALVGTGNYVTQPSQYGGGSAAVLVMSREAGMSLRDWFAGQALSALIARHRADVSWSDVAPRAYEIADEMLAVRERSVADDRAL